MYWPPTELEAVLVQALEAWEAGTVVAEWKCCWEHAEPDLKNKIIKNVRVYCAT